jgi:riboflavin synthase
MFTGLIETIGSIVSRSVSGGAGKLKVKPSKRLSGLRKGDSIAVNGACLTLESEAADGSLVFHTLAETLKRCNFGSLKIGGKVNLERAMSLGDRLDGHLVQGHVDCNAKLLSLGNSGDDIELAVEVPASLAPFMVEKGSIAIDGVSLTIVSLTERRFSVHLIPTTWEATALRFRKKGDSLNLEGDLIGKYVFRQLSFGRRGKAELTMDDLSEAGF